MKTLLAIAFLVSCLTLMGAQKLGDSSLGGPASLSDSKTKTTYTLKKASASTYSVVIDYMVYKETKRKGLSGIIDKEEYPYGFSIWYKQEIDEDSTDGLQSYVNSLLKDGIKDVDQENKKITLKNGKDLGTEIDKWIEKTKAFQNGLRDKDTDSSSSNTMAKDKTSSSPSKGVQLPH